MSAIISTNGVMNTKLIMECYGYISFEELRKQAEFFFVEWNLVGSNKLGADQNNFPLLFAGISFIVLFLSFSGRGIIGWFSRVILL